MVVIGLLLFVGALAALARALVWIARRSSIASAGRGYLRRCGHRRYRAGAELKLGECSSAAVPGKP